MPLFDVFQLCRELHWSWEDYQRTPKPVRALFHLYANAIARAQNAD